MASLAPSSAPEGLGHFEGLVAVAVPASYVAMGGLKVHPKLASVVEEAVCEGAGFSPAYFWSCLERLTAEFRGQVEECLALRDDMQAKIDGFFEGRKRAGADLSSQQELEDSHAFLRQIGYIERSHGHVSVDTTFVDPEIAQIPGPQLVVPADSARKMLNAVNGRWGSLYGALYGFDVVPNTAMLARHPQTERNPLREEAVVEFGNRLLDEIAPLAWGFWADVVRLWPKFVGSTQQLEVLLKSGTATSLKKPSLFVGSSGYLGPPDAAVAREMHKVTPALSDKGRIFLNHHGLHVVLDVDRSQPIGRRALSGINEIFMESALTAILDMEDSVATVDAEDKARVYANVCGVFRGTLEASISPDPQARVRRMRNDVWLRDVTGKAITLPGRALCIVRTVGHHMFTDAVVTSDGRPVPECFLDLLVTVAAAFHDLRGIGRLYNSRAGNVYIVQPKAHGPREVALTNNVCSLVEELFGLRRNTIKLGILDEERRTSLNLGECIRVVSHRIFFINSGFMDRTGDEIHTCMLAGPMVRKADMKFQPWFKAYEESNIDIGLSSGIHGKGQIGKGMWRKPDSMKAMLESKIAEPMAGASTAWVPTPGAATLHSIHYHRVDVQARQMQIAMRQPMGAEGMLQPPLLKEELSREAILEELRENAQSILGYVVRWVDFGVGCSKMVDLWNDALTEDRATLRISSQLLANWLLHGLISEEDLRAAFSEMAAVVDKQNAEVIPSYRPMSDNLETNIAFRAALRLVLDGRGAANGYTERSLQEARRAAKKAAVAAESRL